MTGYGKGMTYTTPQRTVLTIFSIMMITIITSESSAVSTQTLSTLQQAVRKSEEM